MGRTLGLDVGERRIGVALSDPTGTIASPLTVMPAAPRTCLGGELERICREREVERIVVGLPVCLDGTEGSAARQAREFARWVADVTGRPVELWDERLTTAEAERAMIAGGMRRDRRREAIDKVAAQILLQCYLDRHAAPPPESGPPP